MVYVNYSILHNILWKLISWCFFASVSQFFQRCFISIFIIQVVKIDPTVLRHYSFNKIYKAFPRDVVATFLSVKYRFNKMVGMKDFLSHNLTAMVIVVHTDTTTVLREEDVYVSVGRVTVQLALDVAPKTAMAVAQRNRLTTQVKIETAWDT